MTHKIIIETTFEVEREEGKFASREEIAEGLIDAVREMLDEHVLYGLGAEGTSSYRVSDMESEEKPLPPKPRRRRAVKKAGAS